MVRNNYITFNDEELLKLVKQDDEVAFKVIYERYSGELFDSVYNGLHRKEETKEVIQDVFYYLWAKRSTVKITTSLKGYLYISARHAMLNVIRSEKIRKAYAVDFSLFAATLSDNSAVELQDLHDLEAAIEKSLEQLPEKLQTIFHLSWREHLSTEKIASKLNLAPKTVENNMSIVLKHLRESLGPYLASIFAGIWLS